MNVMVLEQRPWLSTCIYTALCIWNILPSFCDVWIMLFFVVYIYLTDDVFIF